MICLTQTEANRKSKDQERQQRSSRKKVLREDPLKQKVHVMTGKSSLRARWPMYQIAAMKMHRSTNKKIRNVRVALIQLDLCCLLPEVDDPAAQLAPEYTAFAA